MEPGSSCSMTSNFCRPEMRDKRGWRHLRRSVARRKLEIAFTIKCRPDDIEAGILRRLQEIGLLRVYVGIESGCQATLNLLGKGVTVQRNIEALAMLDRLGLVTDFFCLMFQPWSTLDTIQAELRLLAAGELAARHHLQLQ